MDALLLAIFVTALCYPGPSWEQIYLLRASCHLLKVVLVKKRTASLPRPPKDKTRGVNDANSSQ